MQGMKVTRSNLSHSHTRGWESFKPGFNTSCLKKLRIFLPGLPVLTEQDLQVSMVLSEQIPEEAEGWY